MGRATRPTHNPWSPPPYTKVDESLFQSTSGSSQRWTTFFQLTEYKYYICLQKHAFAIDASFSVYKVIERTLPATYTFKTTFLCSTLICILKYNGLHEMLSTPNNNRCTE